ncbi:MAG: transcription termination factor Rho [Spirochaetales bacterium]|nr:transcription termination factor Rho [Spirochaetales bacterium]
MDNETTGVVTEETARPVKKVVLKRKPVVKKTPKIKEEETEVKAPVEEPAKVEAVAVAQAPAQVEQPKAEAEPAPKKKRNKAKQKAEQEKKAPAEEQVASTEASAQTSEEEHAESQPESKGDDQSDRRFDRKQNQNQNQRNNQKNNNKKFNNNGKQDQRQNQQKKPMSMEDIAISDEEYQSDLSNRLMVNDLSVAPFDELKERLAEMAGTSVDDYAEYKKQEVVMELIKTFSRNGGVIYAVGTLEILSDGYGFLRSPLNSYLSGPEDVYVSPAIIKFLNLKTGDTIEGMMRTPKENERFFALSKVATVNGDAPIVAKTRISFDNLVPLYPDQRINLETERTDNDVSMRIINLFCPIGKGQRALITAPPRTGKTILLQQIANSITTNHPEIKLMVLLVDERPEEVTDMRRNVRGEVITSTFDEQATRHVTVAEMVIEKAKRLVEHGKDVVILLDSITRLARAYNQTVPASGKILSGGVDSNALHKPKRFFGAARNIENGGSLTIIASALIETGSRMDEVIFEEFKGTGNSEIVLDRRMADRRLYPAINIKKSGTRREDLLLSKDEAARIWILRNAINGLEDLEMTEFLIDKMRKTKNNEAFLRSMNTGSVPEF